MSQQDEAGQQQSARGGHRRRLYPQQQYDFNAAQAPAYGQPPAPGAPAPGAPGAVFTPGAQTNGYGSAVPPDPTAAVTNQFGQLSVGAGGAPATPGVAPQYGQPAYGQPAYGAPGYGQQQPMGGPQPGAAPQQAPQQRLPLNQLYNIDLLQSMPPPITDLDLPPPPIILPSDATVTGSPDANASPEYMRCTLNVVPTTNSLLKKSKLPLALVIRPYTSLLNETAPVPVVSDQVIARCRRCRCYINPFVQFIESTHRWKCNVCGLTNEVPTQFDWDPIKNMHQDRYSRNEINYGVVEFLAPSEYMVRPPQPPVYVFVLDVSVNAISNGLLATAARTIQESLDRLPNKDNRTRVAFIGVDSWLHFFSIPLPSATQKEPTQLVVSDLEDPFLPVPNGLLVNLTECRESIDLLLSNIGDMFASNVNSGNALGSALKAANKLISSVGGKIICLSSSIPNLGAAKLEVREDKRALGTSKEGQLLQTANSFYKSFAVECNKSQVTVDMFLFSSGYQDVASLSNLPRFTGGQTYFYPGWTAQRPEDAVKFAHELGEHLSQEISMEAVLRVRASSGLRMNAFYGNFFNRSSDLCSFPTFPRDQSYVIEVAIEETITKPFVTFQAAVLHTTSDGERRVRVINLSVPTSTMLQDVYASADQLAIGAYYTQKAVERALAAGPSDAQDYLWARMMELVQTYKKELMNANVGGGAPLQFSANLRMLPLLINGLMKHIAFKKNAQISSDLRSAALVLLATLPLKYLIKYIHPDFFGLHDMPDDAGLPDAETGEVVMPPKLNLSGERIVSHGLYLLTDGQTQFLWVGRDAVPALLQDAFGVDSYDQVPFGKQELPEIDSALNQRIRAIIAKNREKKDSITWPSLFIVKEQTDPRNDPSAPLRIWASSFLIEDRTDQHVSYYQLLGQVRDKINS